MKITDALKKTGMVCHDTSAVGHYVKDVDGELFWFDCTGRCVYKAPVSWRLVVQDIWLPYPYHPTPEKCGCVACGRHTKLEEYPMSETRSAVLWLLEQACKKEKP